MATLGFEVAEVGRLCANLYYFGNDTLPILRHLLANDDVHLRRLEIALTRNSIAQLLQNHLRFDRALSVKRLVPKSLRSVT